MKLRHIPFIILAVIILTLMAATFVEKSTDTDTVMRLVYGSWWFIALWASLVVSGGMLLVSEKVWRKPATMLLYCAFVLILVGALVTHLCGVQGVTHLRMGEKQTTFVDTETDRQTNFPFEVSLKAFEVKNYPGTSSPMDYHSTIEIADGDRRQELQVAMNAIGEYRGYRFYQAGYDNDEQGATLAISHDPWGIGITYTGYGLLFLSMLLLMVLPREGFRLMLSRKAATILALMLVLPALRAATPHTLAEAEARQLGDLYIYYNGRICPLQTMAKDLTTKLCGRQSFKGYTAEQVLSGWMLFPTDWIEEPIIKVKGAVARHLGIEGKYASYSEFHRDNGYLLDDVLYEIHSGAHVDNARDFLEADEKMNIIRMVLNGELLKLFPCRTSDGITWYTPADPLPADMEKGKWMFTKRSLDYLSELAWTNQQQAAADVIGKIKTYQTKEAAGMLPGEKLFKAEKLYNSLEQTRTAAMILLTIGLLACVAYTRAWISRRRVNRFVGIAANTVVALALVYLLSVMCLRGYVSGHLPFSNGFETMQFMSLASLLITLVLQRRFMLAMPFGLLLAGMTLLVAMMGGSNPQLTPLMPVLASPLLSLHVCIIMLGYALLAFIMLNGLTAIILNLSNRRKHKAQSEQQIGQLTRISQLLLYPAAFCLAAGIFIGAIWANQSWGRYWGWDPKEVWALITLLVYAVGFHAKHLAWLRRPMGFHVYMVLAFLTILMTYFGVNFFLGGMHAYA